ncbi:MAG TPA: hypothetical protein VI338_00390, partial [Nitrososphaera sp.]|nr:hypothetical protein [Nitrososphaera sp.]
KPNWACTNCGMSSGRRYNVQRHIEKIHQGYSQVVRYTEYIVGRSGGLYSIPLDLLTARPSYETKEKADDSKDDQTTIELIKACAAMRCAQQRQIFPSYQTITYQQETSQQQPSVNDKQTEVIEKNHVLEAAKKIVDHCKSNIVNVAAENPLNSLKTSASYESVCREIVRSVVIPYLEAHKDKNDGSKNS